MGEFPGFLEHFDQYSRPHIEPGPCVKSINGSEIAAWETWQKPYREYDGISD
ncbi:MAG: hypothetical protein QG577_2854 [Thermodesulfobacteriota bacterium]|nr:hypothetical protein [Thermodesulfobacteriota bacterium]